MVTRERDPVQTLIDEINGSCKPTMIAAINGNIPGEWSATNLCATRTFGEPSVAVFADATGRADFVGAKLLIDAPYDKLRLASELAEQMSEKIRARQPKRATITRGAEAQDVFGRGSGCYAVRAKTDVIMRAGQVSVVSTGVVVSAPDGWEASIRPRCTDARLWGQVGYLINGEVTVAFVNLGNEDARVQRGDVVADVLFRRVETIDVDIVGP